MKCPNDKETLVGFKYENEVNVDACDKCGGYFLDKGELEKIQNLRVYDYSEEFKKIPSFFDSKDIALQNKGPDLSCPKCSKDMEKREYAYCSQIIIDTCIECNGVWLHAGELKELEIFFEKNTLETSDIRKGFLSSLLGFFK